MCTIWINYSCKIISAIEKLLFEINTYTYDGIYNFQISRTKITCPVHYTARIQVSHFVLITKNSKIFDCNRRVSPVSVKKQIVRKCFFTEIVVLASVITKLR